MLYSSLLHIDKGSKKSSRLFIFRGRCRPRLNISLILLYKISHICTHRKVKHPPHNNDLLLPYMYLKGSVTSEIFSFRIPLSNNIYWSK
jgi:hypothetical protein